MIWIFQQVSTSPDPLSTWTTPLYNLGGFGCMLALIITGKLWTNKSYVEVKEDRDAWKETAQIALSSLSDLQRTVESEQRSREAANEQHKLTNQLLAELAERKAEKR